jgi:hypothetical protein
MPPIIPAPDPAGLPAPAWLLQILLVFTFVLHLLAMNLLLGGTAMLAISGARRSDNEFFARLKRRLAKALPLTMSLTITLGIAPLLFLQVLYGQAFYTSSVLMAWPWLAVIALVMLAYYGLYLAQFRPDWIGPRATAVAWISALFILATGFLFTNNATLMLLPPKWAELYRQSASGLHLNLTDPTLFPRYLHFVVAAFAVAGIGAALLAGAYQKSDPEWAQEARRYGGKWFLYATFAQVVVGMLFLFTLPGPIRMRFLGSSPVDTALLWCGVGCAVGAIFALTRSGWLSAAVLAAAVALMATVRHRVREMLLQPDLDVGALPVVPQWAMFAIFAVLLVAGLAVVAWMVLKFAQAGQTPGEAAPTTPTEA